MSTATTKNTTRESLALRYLIEGAVQRGGEDAAEWILVNLQRVCKEQGVTLDLGGVREKPKTGFIGYIITATAGWPHSPDGKEVPIYLYSENGGTTCIKEFAHVFDNSTDISVSARKAGWDPNRVILEAV